MQEYHVEEIHEEVDHKAEGEKVLDYLRVPQALLLAIIRHERY